MRLSRALVSKGVAAACLALSFAAPAADAPPVPLLWTATSGDNTVYLLGSFHLLKPGDYPLAPEVYEAMADAELVLFEVPPEELESTTVALDMLQRATRGDGTTLDEDIGPALAARVRAWVEDLPPGDPLGAETLQRFEPWFVGLTVSIRQMEQAGLDGELGLDKHLMARAAKYGKATGGLETAGQQIALFDTMDPVEQVQLLADALDDAEAGGAELEQLHADWRTGRARALWNGMAADLRREFPQLYKAINVDRNRAWLPKIVERLGAPGGDDTLVVVGALHLLGEDGVVEMLRTQGHHVERSCAACPGRGDD